MRHSSQNFYKKLLGGAGENRAAAFLRKQGCKILKRNYRTPFGEADIVARDGEDVVFAEVKTRTGDAFGSPAAAVDGRKQKRYRDVARYYFACTGEEQSVRFDVLEVTPEGVEWLKNAFES